MLSAILFDFGGTLDADGDHWLDRFFAAFERLAPAGPSRALIKEAFYAANRELERDPAIAFCGFRPLIDRHVSRQCDVLGVSDPWLRASLFTAFFEPADRILRRNAELLAALDRDGWGLGVVSNFYGNLQTICDEYGLTPHLDALLDSAVVGLSKPDLRLFALALERLGRAPGDAVFVGDSLDRDLRPAKALGMKTVWLRDNVESVEPEAGLVDAVIRSLCELSALVAAWRGEGMS